MRRRDELRRLLQLIARVLHRELIRVGRALHGVEWNRDRLLTDAEEPADADQNRDNLAVVGHQ